MVKYMPKNRSHISLAKPSHMATQSYTGQSRPCVQREELEYLQRALMPTTVCCTISSAPEN